MKAIFVVAHNKRDFRTWVDSASRFGYPKDQRFAYVAGSHTLYGVDLTPDRIVFVDGWDDRDDAPLIVEQVNVRLQVGAMA